MTLEQQIVTGPPPSLKRLRQPRTKPWVLVHIIVPMSPLLAETVVRILILFISIIAVLISAHGTISLTNQPWTTLLGLGGDTFLHLVNSSTLTASMTLFCLFINQTLLTHKISSDGSLDNDSLVPSNDLLLPPEEIKERIRESEHDILGSATMFLIWAAGYFVLFVLIILCTALVDYPNLIPELINQPNPLGGDIIFKMLRYFTEIVALTLCCIPIKEALEVQQRHHLEAML